MSKNNTEKQDNTVYSVVCEGCGGGVYETCWVRTFKHLETALAYVHNEAFNVDVADEEKVTIHPTFYDNSNIIEFIEVKLDGKNLFEYSVFKSVIE